MTRKRYKSMKKRKIASIILIFVLILIKVICICETRIAVATVLYNLEKYQLACSQIICVPSLGRENVTRMKMAGFVGKYYEQYIVDKSTHTLSDNYSSSSDYENRFFDLSYGLYICINYIQSGKLNDVQEDECHKFADIFYNELRIQFMMSKNDSNQLVVDLSRADNKAEMKYISNKWLYEKLPILEGWDEFVKFSQSIQ